VLLEHEQVFVAGDDAIAFTADCSRQDIVVVWIAAAGFSSFAAATTVIRDRRTLTASAANSGE